MTAMMKKAKRKESSGREEVASKAKVLIVEDEQDLLDLLEYNLSRENFAVRAAASGEEALRAIRQEIPDMVVLDIMLPGMDGLELCRRLKNDPATSHVLILMLTAKTEEADVVAGLELGADDYVTKPFSPRVLLARLRALRRRQQTAGAEDEQEIVYRVGIMSVDPQRHEVRVNGDVVPLTHTEMGIVQLLARRPGHVMTRSQIVRGVQGDHVAVTDRSVDVHVVSLRRKLGEAGDYLQTVRGVGYRLEEV